MITRASTSSSASQPIVTVVGTYIYIYIYIRKREVLGDASPCYRTLDYGHGPPVITPLVIDIVALASDEAGEGAFVVHLPEEGSDCRILRQVAGGPPLEPGLELLVTGLALRPRLVRRPGKGENGFIDPVL